MNNDERIALLAKKLLVNDDCQIFDKLTDNSYSIILRRLADNKEFRQAFLVISMIVMSDNPLMGLMMVLKATETKLK